MPVTIDPRRVFLGYLFFSLGVLLTLYQYWHLIHHGPMMPWLRQLSIIFVNTLAVYIGWVLVYPWHARATGENAGRRHFQWMMAVSLIFCFITMVGLALALIMGPKAHLPTTASLSDDLFRDVQPDAPVIHFPWASYAIATLYMVGYGVIGVGPWILKWVLNQVRGRSTSNDDGPEQQDAPELKQPKRKAYPIETRFVVGRVRRKRVVKREPEDTAQD